MRLIFFYPHNKAVDECEEKSLTFVKKPDNSNVAFLNRSKEK
jgi:hypothetical protein